MLQETDRQKLDGIVQQMVANKEKDATIQMVVNDFKSKYDKPIAAQVEQQKSNALFPATGNEGYLAQTAKTIGNIPGSAFNFLKGIVETPKTIYENITSIPQEFKNLIGESNGDIGKAIERTITEMPNTAYKMFVPQFARSIISGDYQTAQKTLAEDPVGQIAPLLIGAKAMAEKAGVGAQFDKAIQVVAKPVISTAKSAQNAITSPIAGFSKFGVSQSTGLNPETISTAISQPQALGEAIKQGLSRQTTAEAVRSAVEDRLKDLSETGKGYDAIRQSQVLVNVPQNLIGKTLKKFGLDLDKKGKILKTAESRQISNADTAALEDFVKTFGNQKTLSPNAFFNARESLTNIAKFEQGKTNISQLIAKELRKAYDNAGKSQLTGLENLDKTYSVERTLLNQIKKDFIEKNTAGGIKLKDAAVNKIANAAGKGKDALLGRLEEIVPGITGQIKILKAIEDIEAAGGQKVGTYMRAGGVAAGAVTLNPYLIVGAILSTPQIAVPLLKGVGMTLPKIKSTMDVLGIPLKELNKMPETITNALVPK
jgi:endonuclease III